MTTWGNEYGVRVGGKMVWFADRKQATEAEREIWAAQIRAKLAAGGKVILTQQMAEALGISATSRTENSASGKAKPLN